MNVELLREAYAIIDGIPDDRFNLQRFVNGEPDPHYCGTIACAAGWLAMHPKFQSIGLRVKYAPTRISLEGRVHDAWDVALGRVFNIATQAAGDLFTSRGYSTYDRVIEHAGLTDKQLWLARARLLLALGGNDV